MSMLLVLEGICITVQNRKQHLKHVILANYRMFQTTMLFACSTSRNNRSRYFSVIGYGGLRLPFSDITKCLRSLVFVHERLIIAGARVLIDYSDQRQGN